MKRFVSLSIGLVVMLGLLPAGSLAAEERVLEQHREVYYDGISVSAQRLEGGRLVATVARIWPGGRREPLGSYTLDPERARGEWITFGERQLFSQTRSFDYANAEGSDDLAAIARRHTVQSVALSALLLWEESLGDPEVVSRAYGQGCGGCTPDHNGCSGWGETCNGQSVRQACNRHDACYQCGDFCDGSTRAQCDANFRQDVAAATGSADCARIYWLGVRGFGWLFMHHPETRNSMQPDVYSLGIAMTGCPSGYTHLCTIYLF